MFPNVPRVWFFSLIFIISNNFYNGSQQNNLFLLLQFCFKYSPSRLWLSKLKRVAGGGDGHAAAVLWTLHCARKLPASHATKVETKVKY